MPSPDPPDLELPTAAAAPIAPLKPLVRTVTPEELSSHASAHSLWLAIDGLVYDLTKFHHPGGNDRLLEWAGRDATRAFRAIPHSRVAHAHMRSTFVGNLVGEDVAAAEGEPSPSAAAAAAAGKAKPRSSAAPVGQKTVVHGRHLKAGSVHRIAREGEHLWSTRCRGFLPVRDPLARLPQPYSFLVELVSLLPTALRDGTFRALVEEHLDRFDAVEQALYSEGSVDVLERVHSLYGYVGKGYVYGTAEADGAQLVPKFLSAGWLLVSDKLGRQPTIDYADCVLCNWERVDRSVGMVPENLRILNRFTGLLDEEWFLKTHIIIESEASGVVSAIYDGVIAVKAQNVSKLMAILARLEQGMSHLARDCLGIMFERQGDDAFLCDPDLFFHRFRPFITTWTAIFEGQFDREQAVQLRKLQEQLRSIDTLIRDAPTGLPDLKGHREFLVSSIAALQKRKKLCGPSGAMSAILPLCDAFLGVAMSSAEFGAILAEFEEYMPTEHCRLLQYIRRHPVREFVNSCVAQRDTQAESLVDHYNAVVRNVLDFRWRHLSYIEQYVLRPSGMYHARGTGGSPASSYLTQHIEDTEAAFIVLSERADDGKKLTEERRSGEVESALRSNWQEEAHGLWAVSESTGFLSSRPPLTCAALPKAWASLGRLVLKLPAACVPPASFRRLVAESEPTFPTSCDDLVNDDMLELGRSLLAHIIVGWNSCGAGHALRAPLLSPTVRSRHHPADGAAALPAIPGSPSPPNGLTSPARRGSGDLASQLAALTIVEEDEPPPSLTAMFAELSERLNRAPRFGVTDWILYNWALAASPPEPPATPPPELATPSAPTPVPLVPSTLPPPPPTAHSSAPPSHASSPMSPRRRAADAPRTPEVARRQSGSSGEEEELLSALEEVVVETHPSMRTMERVHPWLRFLCLDEEDWFCRLHATLAGESSHLVAALNKCYEAQVVGEQVRALQMLEQAIELLVKVHYVAGIPFNAANTMASPAVVRDVKPAALMQRLHRFLPHSDELGLPPNVLRALRVYCATGIDQSCLLHILGVAQGGHELQRFRHWQQGVDSDLPRPHREYLFSCLMRTSMKALVERAVGFKKLTVSELGRLELAYNSCIDMLMRYFTRRIELVQAIFGDDALAEEWEVERGLIQDARLKLLDGRREMVAAQSELVAGIKSPQLSF